MNLFPIVKRFKDAKSTKKMIILKHELTIHEKCFRSGSVFFVLGCRDVNEIPHLILSKGSWEGLVHYEIIKDKIENI